MVKGSRITSFCLLDFCTSALITWQNTVLLVVPVKCWLATLIIFVSCLGAKSPLLQTFRFVIYLHLPLLLAFVSHLTFQYHIFPHQSMEAPGSRTLRCHCAWRFAKKPKTLKVVWIGCIFSFSLLPFERKGLPNADPKCLPLADFANCCFHT